MFTCRVCGRSIAEPNAENRYCPYCGTAFVLSCANELCGNRADGIVVRRSATCGQCGALYRYAPSSGLPVLARPLGPFVSPDETASATDAGTASPAFLQDLLPASGNPFSDTALLAQQPPDVTIPEKEADFTVNTRLHDVEARHGRIYLIPQNGMVQSLDYESLTRLNFWAGEALPNWVPTNPQPVKLQVSETIVYVLHRGAVNGYDAGNGKALFSLAVNDLRDIHCLLVRNRLLVVGTAGDQKEYARLFEVEHLCDARTPSKRPLWEGELRGSIAPGQVLPAKRLGAYGGYFYLISRSSQLLALPMEGGGFETMYDNWGSRSIHAWNMNERTGVVMLSPPAPQGYYSLVTFTPGTGKPVSNEIQLMTVRPREKPRSVLLWEEDLLLLDESGSLQRLPLVNPNNPTANWGALTGLQNIADLYPPLLIPWGSQMHFVIQIKEQLSYSFRHVSLSKASTGFSAKLPASPSARDDVRAIYCGPNIYVCNMTNGNIKRLPLR
jgi:hypothetical protein